VVRRDLAPDTNNVPAAFHPQVEMGFAQSNRSADCADRFGQGRPCYWHARVVWDGTVIVYAAWDTNSVHASYLMELISSAWSAADALLDELGGYGPRQMELRIAGGGRCAAPPPGPRP
jgi:hypothetical protein